MPSSAESLGYMATFSEKYYKPSTNYKTTSLHGVTLLFSCDSGNLQSASFRIYQLNIRNGFDKTMAFNSIPTKITLSIPDGGYIVMASGHVTSGGDSILVEGQTVFAVNGKDKLFNIKLKPLEGMA